MDGVLRRLDHANIFLIIAGTYTPLTMLLLPGAKGQWLLWSIWAAAAAGIIFRVFWVGAPRWLYTPCYIAMGWAAVFFLPDFMRTGGIAVLVLVIVGGLLYSAGGVIYGLKHNPSPRWFGFHKILSTPSPWRRSGLPLRGHLTGGLPARVTHPPSSLNGRSFQPWPFLYALTVHSY